MSLIHIVGGGFSPLQILNCALYLDSMLGITLDGSNNVSAWADQSSSAAHVSQSNASLRLAYVANQLNGYPVLRGDGTNNLILQNTDFYLAGAFTMFSVLKANPGAGAATSICVFPQAADFSTSAELVTVNVGGYTTITITANHLSSAIGYGKSPTGALNAYNIISWSWNGDNRATRSNYALRFNGAVQTLADSGSLAYGAGHRHLSVACRPVIGLNPLLGDETILALFSRVLTASELSQLERWAGARYGITVA